MTNSSQPAARSAQFDFLNGPGSTVQLQLGYSGPGGQDRDAHLALAVVAATGAAAAFVVDSISVFSVTWD